MTSCHFEFCRKAVELGIPIGIAPGDSIRGCLSICFFGWFFFSRRRKNEALKYDQRPEQASPESPEKLVRKTKKKKAPEPVMNVALEDQKLLFGWWGKAWGLLQKSSSNQETYVVEFDDSPLCFAPKGLTNGHESTLLKGSASLELWAWWNTSF